MRRLTSVVGLIENSDPILGDDRLDTHKFLNSMMSVALNHKLYVLKNHAIVHYSDPMWSTQNLKQQIFRKSQNSRHFNRPNQWSENLSNPRSGSCTITDYADTMP